MKRFLMLVAVATVAGAMYVAAAPGSQQSRGPTARKFAALKRQVGGLTKTLKQVKTLAVAVRRSSSSPATRSRNPSISSATA